MTMRPPPQGTAQRVFGREAQPPEEAPAPAPFGGFSFPAGFMLRLSGEFEIPGEVGQKKKLCWVADNDRFKADS